MADHHVSADHPFTPIETLTPRTLIEASAGTGKTYALCGLTAYLLGSGVTIAGEEVTIDQLLIVTFTKLATNDLKDRIRERLVEVRLGLEQPRGANQDVVVTALEGDTAAVERLERALADLDTLSVSTIHGFAQRSLALFGSTVGIEGDLPVIADDSQLRTDAIFDELAGLAAEFVIVDPPTLSSSDDLPNVDDLLWIPSADQVNKIVEVVNAVPDIVVRPNDALATDDFNDLVAAHQRDYAGLFEECIGSFDGLTGKARTDAIKEASGKLSELFDALQLIRAGWVAQRAIERARKRRENRAVRNYTDLLVDLHDAVTADASGELARRMRGRHRVALIDEFQDTDRIQWEIFDACFGSDDAAKLVVVGDPKQAIYRFRGADVFTYAHVAESADVTKRTLTTNHRSDGAVLAAVDALLSGVSFGRSAPFQHVDAWDHNPWSGIRFRNGAGAPTPLRIVTDGILDADDTPDGNDTGGVKPLHADLIDWLRCLRTGAELRTTDDGDGVRVDADGTHWRDVGFDDMAVLVTANERAVQLQTLLNRFDIPAVIHSDDDVRGDSSRSSFGAGVTAPSEAAWQWRLLLEAIARPSDPARARAAAPGIFGPPDLDGSNDLASPRHAPAIQAFQQRLASWAKVLVTGGAASLLARLRTETEWLRRAAHRADRGALMTDVAHIGELFTTLIGPGPTSCDELISVLDPGDARTEAAKEFTVRRLPSDDAAVTIMTVHKAKGLEFPIVCALGLHHARRGSDASRPARFHDETTGREVLDFERADGSVIAEAAESDREELRKLYVALTRGRNHVSTYWETPGKGAAGPLDRVLFDRDETGRIPPSSALSGGRGRPDGEETFTGETDRATILDAIVQRSITAVGSDRAGQPTIEWVDVVRSPVDLSDDHGVRERVSGPSAPVDLTVATLQGVRVDRRARRWSFSAIERAMVTSDQDESAPVRGGTDEATLDSLDDDETPSPSLEKPGTTNADLQRFRGSAAFGTFVHEILEHINFTDDQPTIERAIVEHPGLNQLGLSAPGDDDGTSGVEHLAAGLGAALRAPIGTFGPAGSLLHLGDIARTDRLSECEFHLRLDTSAGDGPAATPVGARLREILLDHLSTHDPYRPWAEQLGEHGFDRLDIAGFLTGSIDLVYRVTHPDGSTRFHVADYKTNKNPSGDYSSASLTTMMTMAGYPLQALLYQVALHRYLRWRLPGYEPDKNLGTVTYLFLRGMSDSTPDGWHAPPGVAAWDIPRAVVTGVDALFAERGADVR